MKFEFTPHQAEALSTGELPLVMYPPVRYAALNDGNELKSRLGED